MKFHLESNVQYSHIYTLEFLLFLYLNNLTRFASKFVSAYMFYKTNIWHFSNAQFHRHN